VLFFIDIAQSYTISKDYYNSMEN